MKPELHSLEGESFRNKTTTSEDDARLDINANGLWGGRFSQTLFDVKIFIPRAKPCPIAISDAYKNHEGAKTIKHQPRFLEVEHSSFVPLTRRNSTRLYKNRPETSREFKRKMERIILGHNKLYKSKIKFCPSEE